MAQLRAQFAVQIFSSALYYNNKTFYCIHKRVL